MSQESKTEHPFLVLVEAYELLGPCPVFKKGDKILIDEPNVILSETDALCTRAFPTLTTFLINVAEEGKTTGLEGVPLFVRCPATGNPYGPVMFELKALPRSEVE
jgi:hypothetical protein